MSKTTLSCPDMPPPSIATGDLVMDDIFGRVWLRTGTKTSTFAYVLVHTEPEDATYRVGDFVSMKDLEMFVMERVERGTIISIEQE